MRTIVLASLRVHTRRYVAAAIAVIIGVAFIVVTDALASATRNGLVAGVEQPYRNADVVVSDIDGEAAARLVADAAERGDRAAVLGSIAPARTHGRTGWSTNGATWEHSHRIPACAGRNCARAVSRRLRARRWRTRTPPRPTESASATS